MAGASANVTHSLSRRLRVLAVIAVACAVVACQAGQAEPKRVPPKVGDPPRIVGEAPKVGDPPRIVGEAPKVGGPPRIVGDAPSGTAP